MSAHTPGPWMSKVEPLRPLEPAIVVSQRGEEWYVATCHDCPGDGDRLANANLIAAAPDLLAALEQLLFEVKSDMQALACIDLRLVERCEAALKKARAER